MNKHLSHFKEFISKERNLKKYICTDIAQISPSIDELKNTTFDVTKKKQKDIKERIGRSNGLIRHWTKNKEKLYITKHLLLKYQHGVWIQSSLFIFLSFVSNFWLYTFSVRYNFFLFSFFFLLFQISGTKHSLGDIIFFSFPKTLSFLRGFWRILRMVLWEI